MNALTIFLVTHNRPQEALIAIASILCQNDSRFNLVVSDNSSNHELSELMRLHYPAVEYRKRNHYANYWDHWNKCIEEVETTYFVLFHDDDSMLPNFVNSFWAAQKTFPKAIAYGCNAIIKHYGRVTGISFLSINAYEQFICAKPLLARYFSRHQLGISPFPSYIYRKSVSNPTFFNTNAGKYADVQWLSRLTENGSIIWIAEPVMIYNLHDTNEGKVESIKDRLKFLSYLKNHNNLSKSIVLVSYRRFLYKKIITSRDVSACQKKIDIMKRYLLYSEFNPRFILENCISFSKKIRIKMLLILKRKNII